ncbi:hypothetical protein KKB28_09910, partial [bacterium]|nr:hypothetical protein [bacterium]
MKRTLTIMLMLALPVLTLGQAPDSLWSRTFWEWGTGVCYSVQQATDGGYILGGYTGSHVDVTDSRLVKTDANGDCLWNRTFGGSSGDVCYS